MKDFIKKISEGGLWFAGTLCVLIGLLYLTALIPKEMIRENLLESAIYLETNESNFYQLIQGDRRTEIHDYADAITLNIMYSVDGENKLEELIISLFYSERENSKYPMLRILRERIENDYEPDTIYDRYWHGSMLIVRPLFLFFTIDQIRIILLCVLIILLGVLTYILWKKQQKILSIWLLIGAILVQLPMVAFCIEYFAVWLIMLLLAIIAVKYYENGIVKISVISGVSCAFFDFLTTETVAFVIPLAIVLCLKIEKQKAYHIFQGIKEILICSVLWCCSYVATLVVKWSLSSFVLGQERFSTSIQMMFNRQGTESNLIAVDSLVNGIPVVENSNVLKPTHLPQALEALFTNIRLLLGLSGRVTLGTIGMWIFIVLCIIACFVYLYRKNGTAYILPTLLFLIGMIPVVRIIVLNNHSLEHCFFVYRSLFGTIVCWGSALIKIIDWEFFVRKKKMKRGKRNDHKRT